MASKYPLGTYRVSKGDPTLYLLDDDTDVPYLLFHLSLESCEKELRRYQRRKNLPHRFQLRKQWLEKRIKVLKLRQLLLIGKGGT